MSEDADYGTQLTRASKEAGRTSCCEDAELLDWLSDAKDLSVRLSFDDHDGWRVTSGSGAWLRTLGSSDNIRGAIGKAMRASGRAKADLGSKRNASGNTLEVESPADNRR
jgi:hypothetical protein